jgi:hypothetical protein
LPHAHVDLVGDRRRLGWTHFFKQNVFIRPELVYQYALDNPAFQQGAKFTQFVAAADPILRFRQASAQKSDSRGAAGDDGFEMSRRGRHAHRQSVLLNRPWTD